MKVLNLAALASTLLAPTVVAGETVTVQLANTMTGAWANFDIPQDGKPRSIDAIWGDSAVAKDGVVKASSSQFNAFQRDSACCISQHEPHVQAMLDSRRTWTWLADGDVVELSHAHIVCWNS